MITAQNIICLVNIAASKLKLCTYCKFFYKWCKFEIKAFVESEVSVYLITFYTYNFLHIVRKKGNIIFIFKKYSAKHNSHSWNNWKTLANQMIEYLIGYKSYRNLDKERNEN